MDEKPNIQKQLRDAQEQREKLLEQLKESESIIASIETRLSEVTKSQEARLRADDRVDNKLLDQVQQQSKKNREDTPPSGMTVGGKKKDKKEKNTSQHPIITNDNSWYEIIVQEDGSKRERLRKK